MNEYKKLNILNVKETYFSEVGKFMYKHSKSTLPLSFDEYYRHIGHSYSTRTRLNSEFTLPHPRTELGKQSIKFTGVKIRGEPDSGPENAGLSGIFGGPKPVRRPAKNRPDFRTF